MKTNKGFTLIELLVVVLIIGILTAIAVPKYQVAVAKSTFSTLKEQTRAIAEAVNRYQLTTGSMPKSFQDLDISFSGATSNPATDLGVSGSFKGKVYFCGIQYRERIGYVSCHAKFNNQMMRYDYSWKYLKPEHCFFKHGDTIIENLCKQDTGKNNTCFTDDSTNPPYSFYCY